MARIICTSCHKPYPDEILPYRCLDCGGIFDFEKPTEYDAKSIIREVSSLWRYKRSFSMAETAPVITLGEGNTPLIWVEMAGKKIGMKLEYLNPTGSYKDRGSAVLVSQLVARGVTLAVEDSSGNAGASFAAYCSRASVKARIYIPSSASGPKKEQIELFGAELITVPGSRSDAAKAALEDAERGLVYGSHAYLPFGLEGIATIAYELWEILGEIPGTVVAPVGHGGLLLGIVRGFSSLLNAGLIGSSPYYVGVQAQECAPVCELFNQGVVNFAATDGKTIAEGVRVRNPVRAQALCNEISRSHGMFLAIEETRIMPAFYELAKNGFHVEPTSALVWCALKEIMGKVPEPIILILSGSGLKYRL
jgi:threonine synthase